jgi:hypothetical protein
LVVNHRNNGFTSRVTVSARKARFGSSKKNAHMYSRHISVKYQSDGKLAACPMKWLDNFSMRSFTNDSIFDDTLPVADGEMRIGTRVPLQRLKVAMEDWFRKKNYLTKEQELVIEEIKI